LGGSECTDHQLHVIIGEVLLQGFLDLLVGGAIAIRTHVAAYLFPHSTGILCASGVGPEGKSNVVVGKRSGGEARNGQCSG
jgi:hypothetical protein